VLLVAWLSICAAGLLLLADHSLEASREAAARDDIEGAIEAAANARDLEPWAAEPRTQLALLYERGGDATEALQAILEAIDRSPRDFELYLLKARVELVAGNADAARESFQIARRLNPLDPAIRAVDSLIRG
jgi:tetratricopeptide (TPR) repeat protein